MRTTTSSNSIRKPSMNAIAGGLPPTRVYKSPYAHHGLPPRSGMVVGVASLEANCDDDNGSDDGLLDSPASSVSSLTFNESSKVLPTHPGHVHNRYNALQQEARRGNTKHAVPSFAVIGSGLHTTVNANEDNVVSQNRKRFRKDTGNLKILPEGLAEGRYVIPSTDGDDLELGHSHSHTHPHAMNVMFVPAMPTIGPNLADIEDENTVDTPHPSAPVKPSKPPAKLDVDVLSTVVEGTDTSVTTESLLSTQIFRRNRWGDSVSAVLPSRTQWNTASLKSPEKEKMNMKLNANEKEENDDFSVASSTVVMDDQEIIDVANQGQPVRVVVTSKMNKDSMTSRGALVGTVLSDIPAVLTPPSTLSSTANRYGKDRSTSHSSVPITDTELSRTDSSNMPLYPPPCVPATIRESTSTSSNTDDTSLPSTSRWFNANSDTVLLQSVTDMKAAPTSPKKAAPARHVAGCDSIRERALRLERMLHLSRPIASRIELDPEVGTIVTSAATGTATAMVNNKSGYSFEVDIDFDSVGL